MSSPAPGALLSRMLVVIGDRGQLEHRVAEIARQEGLAVAMSSPNALPEVVSRPPEVVVLACSHESGDPVGALAEARRILPTAAIISVVTGATSSGLRSLIGAGADGVVLQSQLDATLGAAIRAVISGQIVLPRELRQLIEPPVLSHREKQILALVIAGMTNAEIARHLWLAESTIKAHLSSAFRRLGVRSRSEAATVVLDASNRLRESVLSTLEQGNGASDLPRKRVNF